jgi:peptidoglycan/xylan/chitin deacetylase (PgdA/CDA1 family)/sulfur carrier protein ThiS
MNRPMAGISNHLRVAACAVAASVVAGCTDTVAARLPPLPPPISITVNGAARQVPPGTTFGELVEDLGLHAEPGRLLSVGGLVLDAHRARGEILVNGAHGIRSATLHPNDRVTVVHGRDVTERTIRLTNELPGLHPAVPQRTLATFPMKQVDIVGRLSGELVSTEFRPTGRGRVPDTVALTFDDGPWPSQTRQVLKVLRRHDAPATFFMVGDLVDRYPGIVHAVKVAGMPIGDHSWSHPTAPPFAELPPNRLSHEVLATAEVLRRNGVEPYLFRPPGGSYDDDVLREANRAGMRTVIWDVDPSDYRSDRTRKELAAYVLRHVRPGSIVLLHDGGGDQRATIGALPMIIKGIRKMGLELTTIPPDS